MNQHEQPSPRFQRSARDPIIYVASLSDYNAGRSHGTWLAANHSPDELRAATEAMLGESPEPDAEEWAIHDYDNFAGIQIDEFATFDDVSHLAVGLHTYGPAFAAFVRWRDPGATSYTAFEQSYAGHWDSALDYLDETHDLSGSESRLQSTVPDWLVGYLRIDSDALARDLQLSGDLYLAPDLAGVHVFQRTES
jgi:antirestriction protein